MLLLSKCFHGIDWFFRNTEMFLISKCFNVIDWFFGNTEMLRISKCLGPDQPVWTVQTDLAQSILQFLKVPFQSRDHSIKNSQKLQKVGNLLL